MKYAYPQDPTAAISAVLRQDERTDSTTQQSALDRQQDIATVGETVPLVFCRRRDWGNDLGMNGGLWISPRLIQLGIEKTRLSMMYLVSQGKITGFNINSTFWGYDKLPAADSGAKLCYAYEKVPDCLDLDYEPGGSTSWDTTISQSGPNAGGQSWSFTTATNCRKIDITLNAQIYVQGSGPIVNGFAGSTTLKMLPTYIFPSNHSGVPISDANSGSGRWAVYNAPAVEAWSEKPYTVTINYRRMNFARWHQSASWTQTSEIRYRVQITDVETGQLVYNNLLWLPHGTTTWTFQFPPGQYAISFSERYAERNAAYGTYTIPDPGSDGHAWAAVWEQARQPRSGPGNGFRRHTNPGSETSVATTGITQTIFNEINFPDLPGGGQQLVGGLSDLTMAGIEGDITKLRPQDGPAYFKQAHLFVSGGIHVERLTLGGTGASEYYGDLVNYLFARTGVLSPEQIDRDSLIQANRMNDRYKMFFNGVLQVTMNFAEWLTRTAPYFLLTPRQKNGKFGLSPVCPLDGNNDLKRTKIDPALVINEDDIVAESYVRQYIPKKDRSPICLVMVYRDQPEDAVGQTVTLEVRYPGTALSGPFESHDLTDFCCRPEQALYAARYILAKRRYTTHTVSFSMTRRAALLSPGDIIQVDLNLSTTDGAGISDSYLYQIESLVEAQSGVVEVVATHFPVDQNGVSIVAKETHEGEVNYQ